MARKYVTWLPHRMLNVPYGIGLAHATAVGTPLKDDDEPSWTTVNGIWVNWPTGSLRILFRRPTSV